EQPTAPPPGPALLATPTNRLYQQDEVARQRRGARIYPPEALRAAADAALVERVLEAVARAERPLIVAGDGVFWSDAAAELRAFAARMQIPVYTRRAAQGAASEGRPLAVARAWQ